MDKEYIAAAADIYPFRKKESMELCYSSFNIDLLLNSYITLNCALTRDSGESLRYFKKNQHSIILQMVLISSLRLKNIYRLWKTIWA